MHIVVKLWSFYPNEAIGDINVRNYDCKGATRLRIWVFINSSYTLHHIMVPLLSCPSYCAITHRQPIGWFGQSYLGHKMLTFKLDIHTRLDQVLTYYVYRAPYPYFLKYSMRVGFPKQIIFHPGLSRINALSETDHFACKSQQCNAWRFSFKYNFPPGLSRINALSDTNHLAAYRSNDLNKT